MKSITNYLKTIFKHFFALTAILIVSFTELIVSSGILIAFSAVLIAFSGNVFAQSTFNSQRLERSIINYVKSVNKCESEVEIDQRIQEQKFTQSGIQASINHNGELTGLTKINIDFLQNGEIIRSQEVRIRVKLFANVPVATRFIPKDDIISLKDVEIKRAEVTNIDPNTVIELEEAEATFYKKTTKSKSGIAKGSIIKYSDLIESSAVTVKKGDKVKLFHYASGICIKTDGVALENGSVGNVIKVKNNDKTLYGFIADDGNIIIENKQIFEKTNN